MGSERIDVNPDDPHYDADDEADDSHDDSDDDDDLFFGEPDEAPLDAPWVYLGLTPPPGYSLEEMPSVWFAVSI